MRLSFYAILFLQLKISFKAKKYIFFKKNGKKTQFYRFC